MSSTFTAQDLAASRERLGLSVAQLAAELGLTPHVVNGMESGKVAIPRRLASEFAWRLGVMEREQALATSGLPTCSWVARWQRAEATARSRGRVERLRALQMHTASCPTCAARHQYVESHFGPLPERPVPAWARALMWLERRVGKLPAPARPAAYGAIIMAIGSLLRIVFAVQLLTTAAAWMTALLGLLLSVAIGAAAGFAFGLVRSWRR